ncbi:MAG: hypothetical protein V4677_15820 [Bacteroidota bacterium]
MKKLLAALFTLSTLSVFAQTHAGINYQSIIRNTGGTVMASTPVTIDFKLYSTVPTFSNTLLYHETHSTTTNQFGMANVVIGKGTMVGGVFSFTNVPWPAGVAYEVLVNSNQVGSRQPFMSVPYAFAAAYAPAPSVTFSNNVLSVGGNTVSITSGSTYTAGNGIEIIGSAINGTANIVGSGATTVTGTYPNLTINTPTTQVYTAGPGIDISTLGVISNTLTPVTPTITAGTNITINPAAPANSYTVSAPTYSLSQTGNNIDLLQNGTSIGTATLPVSTSYSAGNGINISGSVITSTGSISGAGSASVTGSYPNYTINVPAGTTLPTGFNGQFLYNTGGTVWDTLPRTNLYFDGTNFGIGTTSPTANLHVNGDGKFNNSVTTTQLYTTNFKMTGINAGYVLTSDGSGNGTWQSPAPAANYSLTSNSNTITLSNGSSITTATVPVQPSVTGIGVVNVTPFANSYQVNVPMSTYNNTTGVFSTGGQTIAVTPTLTLTGNILRSGPTTNTVSLAALNTWSLSSGVLFPATLTNSVGVGTSGPLTDRMEIDHVSSTGSTQLHLKQTTGGDAFSRIKFTNASIPSKFWLSTVTSAASDANSGHNFFYNNGSIGHNIFTVAGDGRVSVNTFSTMTNAIMDVNGALEIDSTFVVNAIASAPNSSSNSGKIYFDGPSQKFKVSQNGAPFVDLISGPSPWLQGSGLVHLANSTDNVGIGTTSPVASLDVTGNIRVNDKIFFGAVGGINSGYTGIYSENDDLKLAVFKPGAAANSFAPASNSMDAVIIKSQTGNVGIGINAPNAKLDVVSVGVPPTISGMNSGSGHGVFGSSASSVSAGVMGTNDNSGPSIAGVKVSPATGNVANFKNTNINNSADALLSHTDGNGAAIHAINGPSSAASSNIGVLIEEGHIGSAALSNLTASSPNTCGCVGSVTMDSHSTDVAGTLRAVFTSTTGALVDINVTFVKPYKKFPVVTITPGPHPPFSFTQFIVTPIGAPGNYTGFKVSIESGINSSASAYLYNYIVIEGKN